jgi:hypothetical protein
MTARAIDQDLLERAGRAVNRAVDAILETVGCLRGGDVIGAGGAAEDADEAAQSALLALRAAGARVPELPPRTQVPIHLLDTPRTRRLLDALRHAAQCAQAVDEERGWVLASGEGCGLTDTVGDIYERLRQEVEGPKGRE